MPIALSLVLVAAVLAVGSLRLERLRTALALDPSVLAAWLKRHPGGEGPRAIAGALGEAAGREPGDEAMARMAALAAALASPGRAERAAGCNEALVEIEPRLGSIDGDGGLLKLLALGTLLALALLVVDGQGASSAMLHVVALGGGAAAALVAMKRDGERLARGWRQGLDGWVAASLEASGVAVDEALRSGRPGQGGRAKPTGRRP